MSTLGEGRPLLPLFILFGFNALDELDREAFQVLLPNIKEAFGLNLTGVTALVAAVIPAALIFGVPIARLADRRRRVPIGVFGACLWGLFSIMTGLAPTVLLLAVARVGAGMGKAVNDPVHGSLLSDYYPPGARARVFAVHRGANTVGAFCGALGAGLIGEAFGWRVPFFIFGVPTLVLVIVAVLALREPERTGQRLSPGEGVPRFREAFRTLWRVRTLRRIWLAFPFLSFVALGLSSLFSLYYEEVFAIGETGRGFIRAFDSPFIVLGLVLGSPLIDRGLVEDAGKLMRRIGLATASIALLIFGVAVAPAIGVAIAFGYAISTLATVLFAGGTAMVSLVAPPEGRAFAFAFFNISALLGVIALPISGILGDLFSLRVGIAALTPVLLVGALLIASAGRTAHADIEAVNGPRPKPAEGIG